MQHPHLARNNDFLIPGLNEEESNGGGPRGPNMFGANFLHRQFEASAAFERPKFFGSPEFRLKSQLQAESGNNNKRSDFDLKGKNIYFILSKIKWLFKSLALNIHTI